MAEDQDRSGQRDWGGDTAALGGYGSAGLYSRRRQMERTTGGSFLNISEAPRTGGVGGGYVGMPSQGPGSPVVTPLVSGHTGPAGPAGMAPGVAPDFSGRIPEVPNWGQTGALLGQLNRAGLVSALKSWKDRAKDEPQPDVPPFTSRFGGRYGKGPEGPKGLPSGPTRPALGTGEILEGEVIDPDDLTAIGGRKAIGSGDNIIDVESWEPGELRSGMPIAELEASQQRALGPGAIPMGVGGDGRGPGQRGGVVSQPAPGISPAAVSARASRVRSRPTTVVMQGQGGSLAQTAMGEVVSRQVQERRQQFAENASNAYEYPNYNPRLGAKLGRNATRGERRATRDPNQMGLFDPNA